MGGAVWGRGSAPPQRPAWVTLGADGRANLDGVGLSVLPRVTPSISAGRDSFPLQARSRRRTRGPNGSQNSEAEVSGRHIRAEFHHFRTACLGSPRADRRGGDAFRGSPKSSLWCLPVPGGTWVPVLCLPVSAPSNQGWEAQSFLRRWGCGVRVQPNSPARSPPEPTVVS